MGDEVAGALSPSKVSSVTVIDEVGRAVRAVVPENQLSLAIGREGQNARLAHRLTGWKIDIRADTEEQEDAAPQDGPFAAEYAALRRHWKWANFSQFFYTFAHLFGAHDVALAVRRLLSPAAAC